MSLDNVMAVAAIAKGHVWLMTFGIGMSIPFVILGASLIKAFVDKFPWIVWAGAGLLAWVGGAIIVDDPLLVNVAIPTLPYGFSPIPILSLGIVMLAGLLYKRKTAVA